MIGKKFNKLTVIKDSGKRYNRAILWECKCDCGNITLARTSELKSNHKKSCGCLNTEKRKILGKSHKSNLENQRFGKLTVIRDSGERAKDKSILWECKCDCGNTIKVKTGNLKNGNTQSCGCLKSKGEEKIIKILTEAKIPFVTQKSFETCRFDNGYKAYFDFWVDNKYIIEYDGIQHFQTLPNGWNNQKNLLQTQYRDRIKDEWCKNNNIPIIRIPYTKLESLSLEDLILPL